MTSQKKQALQKTLEALIPYRDMAEWFLWTLQETENEELSEALYDTISMDIKSIKDEKKRKIVKNALEKIKQHEKIENRETEQYLEDLIDNI